MKKLNNKLSIFLGPYAKGEVDTLSTGYACEVDQPVVAVRNGSARTRGGILCNTASFLILSTWPYYIIRSAKSSSDWTLNELDAYNVKISFQGPPMFFHMPALPEPTIDQEILTTLSADDTATEDNYTLLTQLDQAMFPDEREESAVDDFMVTLFRLLGYALRPRIIRTRKEMRLLICGEYRFAKADIVIIDKSQNDIILLVQEDKRLGGYLDPLPQLVAEAISAFQSNNLRRVASGLDPLENKV